MGNGSMTSALWSKYIKAVNAYSHSVSNETVIWDRVVVNTDRFGEGEAEQVTQIPLQTLVAYNSFRTWPVDDRTFTGDVDKEYCHLYLNLEYLEKEGFLTSSHQFSFNPGLDRFWINGIKYKPAGDTGTAQANINPLFQILILERDEYDTGNNPRP